MKRCAILAALLLLGSAVLGAASRTLIVADEIPAMKVLAAKLEAGAGTRCTIVEQTAMPADLAPFAAVIVYIHRTIGEPAEKAFIQYARGGGKLVLLHHSISSGKRDNRFWFPFLEITLPRQDFSQGGYKYYEGISMEVVNLAPGHPVTKGARFPIELDDTEVYLNHVLDGERVTLLGIRFRDSSSGKLFEQPSAGWLKRTEKGCVFYFMPGHSAKDFENRDYARVLVNALTYRCR